MNNAVRAKAAALGADAVILTEEGILQYTWSPKRWATGVAIHYKGQTVAVTPAGTVSVAVVAAVAPVPVPLPVQAPITSPPLGGTLRVRKLSHLALSANRQSVISPRRV
jgi:hypothetical protein